jgi:hypothetical protein
MPPSLYNPSELTMYSLKIENQILLGLILFLTALTTAWAQSGIPLPVLGIHLLAILAVDMVLGKIAAILGQIDAGAYWPHILGLSITSAVIFFAMLMLAGLTIGQALITYLVVQAGTTIAIIALGLINLKREGWKLPT